MGFLCPLSGASSAGPKILRQSTPPNVVLIVADDVGFNDIKWDDADNYLMPNLASLAAEGTRFNRFYATPVCSPTRAALLTGRSPVRWGHMASVIYANSDVGTPRTEEMLGEMMEDAGYAARFAVGKWHLGNRFQKFHPMHSGFSEFFGSYASAVDYYTKKSGLYVDWHDGTKLVSPLTLSYQTDVIGDEAAKFIDAHANEPFLLYVPFQAAHFPKQAPQALIDHYTNNLGLPLNESIHLAMIASMDINIGKILDALKFNKIEENTIVWFLSDNGGMKSHGADNSPLTNGKGTVSDGGIRVQSVLRYRGHVPAGQVLEALVSHVDIVPTLREYISRKLGPLKPTLKPLDGRNMSGFIDGSRSMDQLDGKEHFVLRDKRSDDSTPPAHALLSYEYIDSNTEKLWKLIWSGDFDLTGYQPGTPGDGVSLYEMLGNEEDRPGTDDIIDPVQEALMVQKLAVWMGYRPPGSGFPTVNTAGYIYLPNWNFRDQRTDPGERFLVYRTSPGASSQKLGYFDSQGALKEINDTQNGPDGFPGLILQGIGRSHSDGLIYGIDPNGQAPLGVNLYQLDGSEVVFPGTIYTGQVLRLGTVSGIPAGANIVSGDVHPNGKSYYCFDDSTKTLYSIELRNLVATPVSVSVFGNGLSRTSTIKDFAFDSRGNILAFEEQSRRVLKLLFQPDGSALAGLYPFVFPGLKLSGAAWADAKDNLLVYGQMGSGAGKAKASGSSAGLYRLDLKLGTIKLVSSGNPLYDVDGGGTVSGP